VAQTPLHSVSVHLIQRDDPSIEKRKWEDAKGEYRSALKRCQLKHQTPYSEELIKCALEIVREKKMTTEKHVTVALAFIPRLNGLLERLSGAGVSARAAIEIVKQTYWRDSEADLMVIEMDHLRAALAAVRQWV